ncbi:MAG: LuxR family transcriptional regulator [Deltaproteobacteria bacterium]|nr:LuxR family transcriptional regulator [Deltaproteobacteria bacterium]
MISVGSYTALFMAKSLPEWRKALVESTKALGFDFLLYVLMRPVAQSNEVFVASNYPEAWWEMYTPEDLRHLDPTAQHCLKHSIPLIWSAELFQTKAQRKLYAHGLSFGIQSGVTLPVRGFNGELGMISLTMNIAPTDNVRRELALMLPQLSLLRDVAYESGRRFAYETGDKSIPPLTPREIECLRWGATGKSSWEIGQILRCSEAAVNFHMKNVRKKFDVTTRQAAVVRAIQLGLIEI